MDPSPVKTCRTGKGRSSRGSKSPGASAAEDQDGGARSGWSSISLSLLPSEKGASSTGAACRRRRLRLLRYEELPEFLKDNEFIHDHYRSEWPIRDALLSAFSWHNETINVWTHFGGFLLLLALTLGFSTDGTREVVPSFSMYNFVASSHQIAEQF